MTETNYTPETFEEFCIEPDPEAPTVEVNEDEVPRTLPERFEKLLRHNSRVRARWERDPRIRFPSGKQSDSEFAASLMWHSGANGFTDAECVAILRAFYARSGMKPLHPEKEASTLRFAWKGRQEMGSEPGQCEGRDWDGRETTFEGKTTGTTPGPDRSEGTQGQEREVRSMPRLVIPAREFAGRDRPEQPKLIPRLGGRRGGKLGFYGPGGSGKSLTFLNIAVAAAEGKPLLKYPEWSVESSLKVAFISLEDPAAEQLDRLSRLLRYYQLPEAPDQLFIFDRDLEEEGFVLASRGGRLNERAFKRLDSCLGDHKIDLLLVEPKVHLVDVEENSSTENMPWQRRFQDVLIRHGTLAFIGHHAGWGKEGRIHARGTTVFRDWVDGMIQQKEDRIQGKPGFQFTCDKSNFAPRWEPLSILFDPDTGGMEAVDEATGKLPPALLRRCFEEHGGQIKGRVENVREVVAECANCSPATARRAIEAAIGEGWLRKLGRGEGIGLSAQGGSEG